MQYVRSISGSVSKTWNSINPATLSGAIDVIVVEQEDGSLACSPFHVRFGKFSLLRPYEKKVEFKVNGVKQEYSMKLGEGGEAFFVFETTADIPEAWQTSPLVSPATSPRARPVEATPNASFGEPEPFDLALDGTDNGPRRKSGSSEPMFVPSSEKRGKSDTGIVTPLSTSLDMTTKAPVSAEWSGPSVPSPRRAQLAHFGRPATEELLPSAKTALKKSLERDEYLTTQSNKPPPLERHRSDRSTSPPPLSTNEAVSRAINLSKKLWGSNIPTQVTETGDLMLDMTGYKSSEDEALRAEVIARKILSEELEGNYDIGALIGADEKGNLWIYSSEEAKEAAGRRATNGLNAFHTGAFVSTDALSDPGYQSDDARSIESGDYVGTHIRRDSDSAVGLQSPPKSPNATTAGDPNRNYAKTLRLSSDQLKTLDLKPGENSMSFSVNRATCHAYMYLWRHDVPIVISDIDGTITKSDALGHVLNMLGRDWTHFGVAKLYTDIVANGYNMFYLTSRSVGQADTTRAYLKGVVQEGNYRLPKGPVIMSPDRTIAALRREIYLRKPEVFKMSCLRDIMDLFKGNGTVKHSTPFYAGFGNRLTDALSYRSVNIPSTRIFTINSNAEVSLDVLSLNKYKTGYASMREIVDHFFPPVGLLVKGGGEEFTDFNYWREAPLGIEDFSASESETDDVLTAAVKKGALSIRSEDEGEERDEEEDDDDEEGDMDLADSYLSDPRQSVDYDDTNGLEESIMESIEGDDSELVSSILQEEDADDEEDKDDEYDDDDLDPVAAAAGGRIAREETPRPDSVRSSLKGLARVLSSPAGSR
ncbi:Lipin/Ned1/Smp2-domain-containing protein [Cryomyces antarcticus]